jgi:predicted PurR-regulated permease PerM
MLIQNVELKDIVKLAAAIVLAMVSLQLVFALTTVFLVFFTAVILAVAVERPIDKLEERGVSRILSTSLLYVTAVAGILVLLALALPPIASDFKDFITEYPVYSEALLGEEEVFQIPPYLSSLSESFTGSPGEAMSTVFKTFGSFSLFLAVFFIAFFLNVQTGGLRSFIYPLTPAAHKKEVVIFFERVQERVASWLWGKFLSSVLVGVITLIGLYVIGVEYALTLAALAFILNFIPFIGPIIAAIPAIVLAAFISGPHAIAVATLYFFVNGILESFVFGPLLMRKAVPVSPALLILFVIGGAHLGGILGIIIAIPTAAIINLAVGEYLARKQKIEIETQPEVV